MRSRTSLVHSTTPISAEERCTSFPHAKRLGIMTLVSSAALLCVATPVRAQDDQQLASLLTGPAHAIVYQRARDTRNNVEHQPHFIPGIALKLAPRELNKAIALQLTTFPLPSSSGGFAYATDPATGEIRLAAATFGPIFAERALTIGKRTLRLRPVVQPTSFDLLRDRRVHGTAVSSSVLRAQQLLPTRRCGVVNEPTVPTGEGPVPFTPSFERDLLESQISLDIETNTAVFFANYGITDRFDVGAAIPLVTVQLAGSVTSTILRTATANSPTIHSFDGDGLVAALTATETRRPPAWATYCCARSTTWRRTPMRSPLRSTFGCRPATRTICWEPARRRPS